MSESGTTSPETTHAAWGEGNPRLIVTRGAERWTHALGDETAIGSASDVAISLDALDPVHARVYHRDDDEYVVELAGEGELTANPDTAETGAGPNGQVLRHGARFVIAEYAFIFQRDEFADHGRPAGGREGGEYSDQASQPARPDYAAGETPTDVQSGGVENVEDEDHNVG